MIIPNQSQATFLYELPDGNTESNSMQSNTVNTEILTYSFTKVKSSNKTILLEGEIAEQTIVLTNNSNTTIISPVFKDILSAGATYVSGSVIVDSVAQPTYDLIAGFTLPDIPCGGKVTIQYQIIADEPYTVTPITNQASLDYTIQDSICGTRIVNEKSNLISLPVVSNKLSIEKFVDKAFAIQGETLIYTSVVANPGTSSKTSLVFTDTIPNGTTFVSGSVTIDGIVKEGYDPSVGFAIPDLDVGQSTTIVFSVTVN